jgi:hypothetical protein
VTSKQKLELAQQGKDVLIHLHSALEQLHEIEVLMVEKAAAGLIGDAAAMIHREIMIRCKL